MNSMQTYIYFNIVKVLRECRHNSEVPPEKISENFWDCEPRPRTL